MLGNTDRTAGRKAIVLSSSLVVYLALSHLSNGVLVIEESLLLRPSAGLAIPLGLVFGLPAALGVGLGVLLDDVLRLAFSVESVFVSLSHVVAACFAHVLWRNRIYPFPPRTNERFGRTRFLSNLAVVSVVVAATAAAFLAWGYEVLGTFPFYVSFATAFVNYLLATALLAPLIAYPAFRRNALPDVTKASAAERNETFARSFVRESVVVVPAIWVLFGTLGSVGFKIRERLSVRSFRKRDLEILYEVIHPDVFGHGGRRAQVVFGALLLLLLVFVTSRLDRRTEGSY